MFEFIYNHSLSLSKIFLYLVVYNILLGILIFFSKREDIIKNWSQYRFKPYILPLSGWIKSTNNKSPFESTLDNFNQFLWNIFKQFFDILIKPFQYILNIIRKILNDITGVVDNLRGQLTIMRNMILGIIMGVMKKIENIVAAGIFTAGKLNDLLKRQLAIYQNIVYMMETLTVSMNSFIQGSFNRIIDFSEIGIWVLPIFTLGAPGVVFPIMPMCFGKDTTIHMKECICKKISDVKLDDILIDNSKVISKIKVLSNCKIYRLGDILVSGEHYVFWGGNPTKVCNIPNIESINFTGFLYNLNTTSNRIFANDYCFLDYDENIYIDKVEEENSQILQKLNGYNKLNRKSITDLTNRRYKLGFIQGTMIQEIPIENIPIMHRLNYGSVVIGIIAHIVEECDKLYSIEGTIMTEWVKIFYNNTWINVRDHPNAIYVDHHKIERLYSIITTDHCIKINNHIYRDFAEI